MYHIRPNKKTIAANECTTTAEEEEELVYLLRSFVFLEIDMAGGLRVFHSFLQRLRAFSIPIKKVSPQIGRNVVRLRH